MSAKYSWQWQGETKWHRTLLLALKARQYKDIDCLYRRRATKRGSRVEMVFGSVVNRVLANFIKCQVGAVAVDMGLAYRPVVQRIENATALPVECAARQACNQGSVRVARALLLAAGVGSLDLIPGALTALRLRSRRTGETAPAKLLEAFIQAEFPRRS